MSISQAYRMNSRGRTSCNVHLAKSFKSLPSNSLVYSSIKFPFYYCSMAGLSAGSAFCSIIWIMLDYTVSHSSILLHGDLALSAYTQRPRSSASLRLTSRRLAN